MSILETKRKVLVISSVVVAVIIVSVVSYIKYQAHLEAARKNAIVPIVDVTVTTVVKKDVPIIKEWVGTTQGDVDADIFAKVSGYLLKQDYEEGKFINKGDVLFEIDPRTYQAALDQASSELEKAKSAQKKSQEDVKRYGALVGEGAVSRKEYTDAARTNDMNKSAIGSAKADLDQAQLNLNWTKVTAPISGYAGTALVDVGDLIDPSKKLTTVSVTDPIKVTFPISENEYLWQKKKYIEDMKDGKKDDPPCATIVLNDGSIFPQQGDFIFTDRQINPNTGTINIQVKAPNPDGLLKPGQYAKIRAQVGMFNDSLVIPRRAIIETQGTTQLAVVGAGNKIEMRNIKVGYIFDNNRIVTDGVKEGETIVVEGFLKIREGMVVNPKK